MSRLLLLLAPLRARSGSVGLPSLMAMTGRRRGQQRQQQQEHGHHHKVGGQGCWNPGQTVHQLVCQCYGLLVTAATQHTEPAVALQHAIGTVLLPGQYAQCLDSVHSTLPCPCAMQNRFKNRFNTLLNTPCNSTTALPSINIMPTPLLLL